MPNSDREDRILAQWENDLVAEVDLVQVAELFPLPPVLHSVPDPRPPLITRAVRWLNAPRRTPVALGLTLVLEAAAAMSCEIAARTGNIVLLLGALGLIVLGILPLAAAASGSSDETMC